MSQARELAGKLLAGDRRALARTITHIENASPLANDLLAELYPHTGQAQLLGVTGPPGTGKSSLVNALARHIRQQGHSVGIIAVDPSSPFTQGAVLGDRIRMRDLAGDAGVFIRSMASRGSLGGLARTTPDVARVLDAAGFDVVIIETVGAGQSEVAIASAAQTTLVIEAPGLGDDIQANKAGILEIADVLVVNKADQPGAEKAIHALQNMLQLGHHPQRVMHHGRLLTQSEGSPPSTNSWRIPVIATIATNGQGIPELYAAILAHQEHLKRDGTGAKMERYRLEAELTDRLKAALLDHFLAHVPATMLEGTLGRIQARQIAPGLAVEELMTAYR